MIVSVFEPATSVPDGIAYVYSILFPRHVPRVTPRLSGWLGAGGVLLLQLFTVTIGRPPANASVVAILSVRAPVCEDERVKRTVTGPMSFQIAIGKEDTDEEPTVYVIPAQPPMRESDGCIVSILSAFLKPAGVPSKSPICQMYVVCCVRGRDPGKGEQEKGHRVSISEHRSGVIGT